MLTSRLRLSSLTPSRICRTSRPVAAYSLFFGISDGLSDEPAAVVQNAAARLVTGTRRCDHITPVLRLLLWLPVRQRVDFKVATLVHRSLSGNSVSYLAEDCLLSPTLVSDDYAPLRAGHALLPGPTAPLVTELLQLPLPGCGTV